MKKLFYLLCLLFISCTTTFNTNVTDYNENQETITLQQSTEHIEANYKPNKKLILFDIFCMPFVSTYLCCREVGRVSFYSLINIPIGFYAGAFPNDGFCLYLPDLNYTKYEIQKINKRSEEYEKYKKYIRPLSITTLKIDSFTEETVIINDNIDVETTYILEYTDNIKDTILRVSKKSSLIGEEIGSIAATIISCPFYCLGWLWGVSSGK